MKKMTLIFSALFLVLAVHAASGEFPVRFEGRNGLSCELEKQGLLRNIAFNGEKIASYIQVVGSYQSLDPKLKQTQFYQEHRYEPSVKIVERKADKLVFVTEMPFSNKDYKNGASMICKGTITGNAIRLSYEITVQDAKLGCRYLDGIFTSQIHFLPTLYGAGCRIIGQNGKSDFQLIPKQVNSNFRMEGREIVLATPSGNAVTVRIGENENSQIVFADSRSWGGKNFFLCIGPLSHWSPKVEVYPKGTVWKWSCSISFRKMK